MMSDTSDKISVSEDDPNLEENCASKVATCDKSAHIPPTSKVAIVTPPYFTQLSALSVDDENNKVSTSRQRKFDRLFSADGNERVLKCYSCALFGDKKLLQGHLYITKNYFAFYSNVFGYVTKILIPVISVEEITKKKIAKIIPNALCVSTNESKHIFGSMMSRDSAFSCMCDIVHAAKSASSLDMAGTLGIITQSEGESSETMDEASDMESEASTSSETGSLAGTSDISTSPLWTYIAKVERIICVKRNTIHLTVTRLLLILLFLSALVLHYKTEMAQSRYEYVLGIQDGHPNDAYEAYHSLLQWKTVLRGNALRGINYFLESKLEHVIEARRSLEVLWKALIDYDRNGGK